MQEDRKNDHLTDLERQFLEAVENKIPGKAEKLLSRKRVSSECRDDKGRTPLIKASEAGDPGMVRLLLRHGADVNAVDADGETALMKAAYGNHRDVVEILDSQRTDLGIRNNEGKTVLEIADENEANDVVTYLFAQRESYSAHTETPGDPDDQGPTTDSPAAVSVPVASGRAHSPAAPSYIPELDLASTPELKDSPFFTAQTEPEFAREEEINETEAEPDDSITPTGESLAGAPKQKPTASQMVAKVKTFLVTYVIMGLEAIGAYLLENVFDGNYKKALSKDPYKGTSLADLADHPDMPLSRQRLGECIRVAGVTQEFKTLGLNLDFLTYYHKYEISKLKNPEERLKLAQEAHTETLTVREVRERVRKITGKAISADKRMAQAVIKQLGVFSQMSVDEETQEFLKDKDRLKAALTTGETAKLLDHSEKFREAFGESEKILHRLKKTLVEIVVERQREDEMESE